MSTARKYPTVGQLVAERPGVARVFERLGIDYCCGGKQLLDAACAEKGLDADLFTARSIVPAGTGALRDFSYIAPEIPLFEPSNCVGCMDCVTECPDTAILAKAIEPQELLPADWRPLELGPLDEPQRQDAAQDCVVLGDDLDAVDDGSARLLIATHAQLLAEEGGDDAGDVARHGV